MNRYRCRICQKETVFGKYIEKSWACFNCCEKYEKEDGTIDWYESYLIQKGIPEKLNKFL